MKRLLVSNAGGTIAQSISRILKSCQFPEPIELIGLVHPSDIAPVRMFDEFFLMPPSYSEPDGVDATWLSNLARDAAIDLLIPTTDYETVGWASVSFAPPTQAVVSPFDTTRACYDKWITSVACSQHGIPFAPTCLPSQYDGSFQRAIAKPRCGGLSRGVIHEYSGHYISSNDYIVQKWLAPPEVTFSFYATLSGTILGPLALERTLKFGITSACLVRDDLFSEARSIAEALQDKLHVRGPCNVQCRFNDDGGLIPFEVNCRFSGTCGIRADIGFNDIKFCINEYLFNTPSHYTRLESGGGIRQISEVASTTARRWTDLQSL